MKVGVDSIDQEHRVIVEQYAILYEKMRGDQNGDHYNALVGFLKFYVQSHMIHEEALQKEIGYPNFQEHKASHDEFRDLIQEILTAYQHEPPGTEELIQVSETVQRWLHAHIDHYDRQLGQFYHERFETV